MISHFEKFIKFEKCINRLEDFSKKISLHNLLSKDFFKIKRQMYKPFFILFLGERHVGKSGFIQNTLKNFEESTKNIDNIKRFENNLANKIILYDYGDKEEVKNLSNETTQLRHNCELLKRFKFIDTAELEEIKTVKDPVFLDLVKKTDLVVLCVSVFKPLAFKEWFYVKKISSNIVIIIQKCDLKNKKELGLIKSKVEKTAQSMFNSNISVFLHSNKKNQYRNDFIDYVSGKYNTKIKIFEKNSISLHKTIDLIKKIDDGFNEPIQSLDSETKKLNKLKSDTNEIFKVCRKNSLHTNHETGKNEKLINFIKHTLKGLAKPYVGNFSYKVQVLTSNLEDYVQNNLNTSIFDAETKIKNNLLEFTNNLSKKYLNYISDIYGDIDSNLTIKYTKKLDEIPKFHSENIIEKIISQRKTIVDKKLHKKISLYRLSRITFWVLVLIASLFILLKIILFGSKFMLILVIIFNAVAIISSLISFFLKKDIISYCEKFIILHQVKLFDELSADLRDFYTNSYFNFFNKIYSDLEKRHSKLRQTIYPVIEEFKEIKEDINSLS